MRIKLTSNKMFFVRLLTYTKTSCHSLTKRKVSLGALCKKITKF